MGQPVSRGFSWGCFHPAPHAAAVVDLGRMGYSEMDHFLVKIGRMK